jgi:hypothetical protein
VSDVDRSDEVREWYAEEEPDGAQLLDDVRAFLKRFVAYPSESHASAHALWIAHCWWMDSWDSTPRIAFLSPEPGSGKTRALEVTEPLVPRPIHSINATAAFLFRKVCDPLGRPTILYDECDTVFGPKAREHEEVRGLVNAGHRPGATAGRCVVVGKEVRTEELPAYCAVALAGLDDLPDTIMTRSVIVRMKRRRPDERVEPWRRRINGAAAAQLYRQLMAWSNSATPLQDGWPSMPNGIEDRDADVWEALLAVADLAGDHWPTTARAAAVKLVGESRDQRPSLGVQLLRDIRQVFGDADKLPTADILLELNKLDEAPWAKISRGEALNARGLAQRLVKYGIKSRNERVGPQVLKSYARAEFVDAWERYLDDSASDSENNATDATNATSQFKAGFDVDATATEAQQTLQLATPQSGDVAATEAQEELQRATPQSGDDVASPAEVAEVAGVAGLSEPQDDVVAEVARVAQFSETDAQSDEQDDEYWDATAPPEPDEDLF